MCGNKISTQRLNYPLQLVGLNIFEYFQAEFQVLKYIWKIAYMK